MIEPWEPWQGSWLPVLIKNTNLHVICSPEFVIFLFIFFLVWVSQKLVHLQHEEKYSFYFAACLLLVLFWTLCYLDPKKRMM